MIAGGALPPGCACHSTNKKMVVMHAKFGISDCGKCHGNVGEIFKSKPQVSAAASAQTERKRMSEEKICQECHQ